MDKLPQPLDPAEILKAIREEQRNLRYRLNKLDERARVVEGWLAEERALQQELPLDRPKILPRKKSLTLFLRDSMADGKPRSNEELAELARIEGIVPNHVDLRSIHSRMMALQRSGVVSRDGGRWIKQE